MTDDHHDPPLEPFPGTTRWVESSPEPILANATLAGLITRAGMALNAISIQLDLGLAAHQQQDVSPGAIWNRNNLGSLVTVAALTFEARRLAQENMAQLRTLAQRGGAPDALLTDIGRLCAGNHPASELLTRARNQLAFHWDQSAIEPIVSSFATNATIVWAEEIGATKVKTVYRLADEVLSLALFPDAGQHRDAAVQEGLIRAAIKQVLDAMNLVGNFLTFAVRQYFAEAGVAYKSRAQ